MERSTTSANNMIDTSTSSLFRLPTFPIQEATNAIFLTQETLILSLCYSKILQVLKKKCLYLRNRDRINIFWVHSSMAASAAEKPAEAGTDPAETQPMESFPAASQEARIQSAAETTAHFDMGCKYHTYQASAHPSKFFNEDITKSITWYSRLLTEHVFIVYGHCLFLPLETAFQNHYKSKSQCFFKTQIPPPFLTPWN